MATLNATNLKHASSGSNNIVLASDGSTTISNLSNAGKILQVVSTTKTNSQSTTTANSYVDISGFSLAITPTSTSSKIFVQIALQHGGENNSFLGFKVYRDSTGIGLNGGGDASGNITVASFGGGQGQDNDAYRVRGVAWQHLDSPNSTSSLTYKVQFASLYYGYAVYINRPHTLDTTNYYTTLGSSSFTLMEVAA
tara:strand:- start:28 stop:615 length:588 start_codon:yes stop_codon:yes gene_type:complete